MGPVIETIIGGLMSGMLYSLVALGFVLIFKASGVFNFAQGAMVLFAALAMARFAEWIPVWTGLQGKWLPNILAFAAALLVMVAVAWLIERLVLGKLVNQEGVTLLMATLGVSYFLDGFGQTIFGSSIYKIDIGMPKEPLFLFENMFQGGILTYTDAGPVANAPAQRNIDAAGRDGPWSRPDEQAAVGCCPAVACRASVSRNRVVTEPQPGHGPAGAHDDCHAEQAGACVPAVARFRYAVPRAPCPIRAIA